MDIDEVNSLKYEILDHYSPTSQQVPSYLENINLMCFVPPVLTYSDLVVPLQRHSGNVKSKRTKDIRLKD